jgi:hypothetical protein
MMKSTLKTVCTAMALSLTACGGGVNTTLSIGGTVVKSVTNPTYPLASAVSAFLQSSRDYTLKAKAGADVYELTWHSEPGTQGLFEGHLASTLDYSNTITKNGEKFAGSTLTDYFEVNPFHPYGGINHTLGNYDVASNQQPLPPVALAGQSGFLSNGIRYADSSKGRVLATSVTTWSLEDIGLSAAWACLKSSIVQAGGNGQTTSESVCYKIDTSGNAIGFRVELTLNDLTLTFQ